MIKNYFVLDLSNLSADMADKFFFDHLHLDSKKAHFEVLTTIPEQISARLKKYNLKASLELTAMYIDQPSCSYFSNSIDKAYFKGFHYISFFNKQNKSLAFVPSQIEVPARVYYSQRVDSEGQKQPSIFTLNHQTVEFKTSLQTSDQFAGVPFFGTFFPVLQLTKASSKIQSLFANLKHPDLVGFMLTQVLLQDIVRSVFIPENKTLYLQSIPKGTFRLAKKNRIHKLSFMQSLTHKATKSLFRKEKKHEEILREVYS